MEIIPIRVYADSGNVFSGTSQLSATDSATVIWSKKEGEPPLATTYLKPLPDGIDAKTGIGRQAARHWIWMTDWGPYDFRGPICFLKKIDGNRYEFWMNAAGAGRWEVKQAKGFKNLTMNGGFPTKLVAERNPVFDQIYIQFEATFNVEQTDQFGNKIPPGQPYVFDFQRFEPKMDWNIAFQNYDEKENIEAEKSIAKRFADKPGLVGKHVQDIAFSWWNEPEKGMAADHFLTLAECDYVFPAGKYRFELTSDDGARLWLGDRLLIDHWQPHEPTTDEVEIDIPVGQQRLRIEHYDKAGFSTLDLHWQPVR